MEPVNARVPSRADCWDMLGRRCHMCPMLLILLRFQKARKEFRRTPEATHRLPALLGAVLSGQVP